MKRYRLSTPARADIDGIWLYLAKKSNSILVAERLIWRIHDKIVKLAMSPLAGRKCRDIDEHGRCSQMGDYIIYYREGKSRILVTRVIHSKRDQQKAWRQKRPRTGQAD